MQLRYMVDMERMVVTMKVTIKPKPEIGGQSWKL
jgi:hypothetical protein